MFWIASMALETKFKVKTCQTMRYSMQPRIFAIPHTPSIDDLGFDCGVYLSPGCIFIKHRLHDQNTPQVQIYTPGVYLHRGVYCAYERGFSLFQWRKKCLLARGSVSLFHATFCAY